MTNFDVFEIQHDGHAGDGGADEGRGGADVSDNEEFDQAVMDLAEEDGVLSLLAIPGVWEVVAEHYNNAAIDRIRENGELSDA